MKTISTSAVRVGGRRLLATVTATGVLVLGGAGVATAADGSSSSAPGAAAASDRRERSGVRLHALRTAFGAAADILGMTAADLRAAMKDGPQSIASVAGDQTDAVVDAIVGALGARIDGAAANGVISTERAEQAKSRLPELAERFVNRVPGSRAA